MPDESNNDEMLQIARKNSSSYIQKNELQFGFAFKQIDVFVDVIMEFLADYFQSDTGNEKRKFR